MLGLKLNHVSKRDTWSSNTSRPMQIQQILDKISRKFVPRGLNWQYFSVDSDNGLAPARQQVIIRTNAGWLTDAYMGHSVSIS